MIPFTENLRYDYPLNPDSVVIDAGGYEGNFARTIAEKYGCRVYVYEPVLEFAAAILQGIENTPLAKTIKVFNAGLGAYDRKEVFGVKGDQTGIACGVPNRTEEVQIVDILTAMEVLCGNAGQISLLKLNVEGMEFEILESLLDRGITHRFDHIQVQPHAHIPRAKDRWDYIKNMMQMNHRITWDAEWCWTGFSLR